MLHALEHGLMSGINGVEQSLADVYTNGDSEKTLNFTVAMLADGENTIVIKATGYEDLTLSHTK